MDHASTFKLSPPTFSSKKEEWGKFFTDFCSYLIIQGGENLVNRVLGSNPMNTSIVHNPHGSPQSHHSTVVSGSVAEDDDEDHSVEDDDEGHGVEPSSTPLTEEDMKLNSKFYHILKLCLKGASHDTILHVHNKTWTEAMTLLQKEYGNSTSLRKSRLIIHLFELSFDGDIDKFK